jgi:ABC-type antimicrobial peptide transport system permease subunit
VAQVYTPLKQTAQQLGGLVLVRMNGDPAAATTMIREAAWAIDPNMPVQNVRTLDDIRDRYLATPKLTALLLTIVAALALLVTMAGITGVIATSVSQRTQEFGVRMALGASRDTVLRMVIGEGLLLVGLGLVLGAIASFAATRVLATYLFDTTPTDPITFAAVVVAFMLAGIVACLGPAWRATTVDPMLALRAE